MNSFVKYSIKNFSLKHTRYIKPSQQTSIFKQHYTDRKHMVLQFIIF